MTYNYLEKGRILEECKELIKSQIERFGVRKIPKITGRKDLEKLGLDSIDKFELGFAMEQNFCVQLDDSCCAEAKTVKDLERELLKQIPKRMR